MAEAPGDGPTLTLRIAAAADLAAGIRGFELVHPAGDALPPFTPGAHLRVRTPAGAWRTYSICSDAAERHRYRIAVKLEQGGRGGSRSMHEAARAGDPIEVSMPENAFELRRGAQGCLFIAGGIGITPIVSMIRALRGTDVPWKLWYLTRSRAEAAFADELCVPEWKPRVTLHHDGGDPARAFDLWPVLERPTRAHIHCCGPRGLMDSVRDMAGHWPRGSLHFESFAEGGEKRPDDRPFRVRLAKSGRRVEVAAGTSILAALRAAGMTPPASCESGTCGTCRTRLVEGEADHRDMVLLPEEGTREIMICVSRARSDELVLDL